jgi:hypothetical protein
MPTERQLNNWECMRELSHRSAADFKEVREVLDVEKVL